MVHGEKRDFYQYIRQNAEKEYEKDSTDFQRKLEQPKMQRKIAGFEKMVKKGERKQEKSRTRSQNSSGESFMDRFMKYR